MTGQVDPSWSSLLFEMAIPYEVDAHAGANLIRSRSNGFRGVRSAGMTRRGLGAGFGAAALTAGRAAHADLTGLETRRPGRGRRHLVRCANERRGGRGDGPPLYRRYPGIAVSVIRTTGQVAYERLQQELKNNTPTCDVFSSTDISQYPALIKRNALAHYEPVNASELATPYRGLGEKGFYYPTTGPCRSCIYNTKTGYRSRHPAPVHRPARPEVQPPGRRRPSRVQRLFRSVGAGDAPPVRVELLRKTGGQQSAGRPVRQRPDHHAERRRVRRWHRAGQHLHSDRRPRQPDRYCLPRRRDRVDGRPVRGGRFRPAPQRRPAADGVAAQPRLRRRLPRLVAGAGAGRRRAAARDETDRRDQDDLR